MRHLLGGKCAGLAVGAMIDRVEFALGPGRDDIGVRRSRGVAAGSWGFVTSLADLTVPAQQLAKFRRRAAGLVACARLSPQQAEGDVNY